MTRIAVVIAVTGIAFIALIILAGRTDWYAMSYRVSSGAIDALTDEELTSETEPGAFVTLSDPSNWNLDFMRGASSSAACPTDTIGNARTRMTTIGPYTLGEFERTVATYQVTAGEPGLGVPTYNRVSVLVRGQVAPTDRIYVFRFTSIAADREISEFSGHFVTRGDCVVHVEVTGFDE